MAGKLAIPSFSAGPDEKAEVADVYNDSAVIEEVVASKAPNDATNPGVIATAKQQAIAAATKLKNTPGLYRDVAKVVSFDNGKVSVDADSALTRMKKIIGENPIDAVKDSIIDRALGMLGFKDSKDPCQYGQTGSTTPKASTTTQAERAARNGDCNPSGPGGVPGALRNIVSGDLTTKRGIRAVFDGVTTYIDEGFEVDDAEAAVDLLNTVIGDDAEAGSLIAKLDLQAQAATFSSLLDKATALGIPGTIDIILDKIDDDEQKRDVMLRNLRLAVQRSDMAVIEKAIEIVGAGGVLARVPDFVKTLVMFYRFPGGTTPATYQAKLTQLKTVLSSVKPNWDKYAREVLRGEPAVKETDLIYDLDVFAYISPDAKTLFLLDPDLRAPAMVGPEYRSESILKVMKKMYPLAAFDMGDAA